MTGEPQPNPPTIGDLLSAVLGVDLSAEAERVAERAQFCAATELARQIAPLLRSTEGDVFEALTYVPDNMLGLLQTREGWTALSAFVAADLGASAPHYQPTLH